MKSFIQHMIEVSYTPTKDTEHDEVKHQAADSKTKEGKPYYSSRTRRGLKGLTHRKNFKKALKRSKTTTMSRGDLEKTGNFDSRVTGLAKHKVKRVSGQFKSGEVERPVVMKHRGTGEKHLLGGNTRAAIGSSRKHGGKVDVQVIKHGRKRLPMDRRRRVGAAVQESTAWQYITEREQCQVYTPSQIKDLEKFADRLLNKYDIDIEFTRHFRDRMNDNRNRPCIQIAELQKLFQKMERFHGKRIKGHGEGQAVILDMQRDLNLPVVIDMKKGKFEVRAKTIMRKKNFKSQDKRILY